MNPKILLLLLSAIARSPVYGQPTVARFDASCGLVDKDIYCFGGVPAVGDNTLADNTTMMIDLTICNGNTAAEIKDRWFTETPNTNGVDTQPRSFSQNIALPDGHRFLLSGGFNGRSGSLADQTIVYDVLTKKWSKYANFEDGSFGNRQIYYASTVQVPDLGIGFYGGFEQNINPSWTMGTGQNLTKANFNKGVSRVVGYPKMTFLNLNASTFPWSIPSQSGAPTVYSAHQTSIYDSASKNVYFFGGEYYDLDDPQQEHPTAIRHSFSSSLVYNVETGSWGNQTWGGANPSSRKYHTTTLLPSKRDILLYGGESKEGAVADVCYVLNLDTKQWVQQTMEGLLATEYIRTRHSAVLVDTSNTLFILFGKNGASVAVNDMLMLNVTDPRNISRYETYYDSMRWSLVGPQSEASSRTPLIVGVSVGGVIAVALLVGFAIYFWRKRRAGTKSNDMQRIQYAKGPVEAAGGRLERNRMPGQRPDNYSPMVARPSYLRDDEATLIGSDEAPATRIVMALKPSNNRYHHG
ncbi:unnamed protein product [Mucor circinelloides]